MFRARHEAIEFFARSCYFTEMKLTRVILFLVFVVGCSGMSEQMTVGFVKGMRSIPQLDFTPEERERLQKAKERFEILFAQEIKKKLEEKGLEDLKGWMVLLRFHSDGFTKTANLSLYTYWKEEERQDVISVPFGRFVDETQTVELVGKATEAVTERLLKKVGDSYTLLANPHTSN